MCEIDIWEWDCLSYQKEEIDSKKVESDKNEDEKW